MKLSTVGIVILSSVAVALSFPFHGHRISELKSHENWPDDPQYSTQIVVPPTNEAGGSGTLPKPHAKMVSTPFAIGKKSSDSSPEIEPTAEGVRIIDVIDPSKVSIQMESTTGITIFTFITSLATPLPLPQSRLLLSLSGLLILTARAPGPKQTREKTATDGWFKRGREKREECVVTYCENRKLQCHYWEPPQGQYNPLTGTWEKGGMMIKDIGTC